MSSLRARKVEYAFVGDIVGAPGCPAPAPVCEAACRRPRTLQERSVTACTRQKYVPFGRRLPVLRDSVVRRILQGNGGEG